MTNQTIIDSVDPEIRNQLAQRELEIASGASIDSKTARTAFWHSPYTNADAKAAQKAFGLKNLDAAKEFIGKAVLTRNEGPLEQKGISRARYDNHDCTVAFARSPYTDADAKQALSKMPFLKNVAEAKEYIGLKIVNHTEDILRLWMNYLVGFRSAPIFFPMWLWPIFPMWRRRAPR